MDMGGSSPGLDSSANADAEERRVGSGGRLAELYRLHADSALRLAWLLTGDAALAQDLVQDAFVKLAGRLAHIRNPEAFPAYLRTTVVNLARMHYRKRRRERDVLARQAILRPPEAVEPDALEEEAFRIRLEHLTDRQRAAIVLRFHEDLSDTQTAEILGCASGTVRSLVSRAMETLRKEAEP
jgi:RNA polymerase sigma-70 factor (sigma-E family)